MAQVTEPGIATLSGGLVRRHDCQRVLEAAGFKVLDPGPLPDDPTAPRDPHRGLPAHRNPDEALKAGVPNAGHTPGTLHPETGDAYEDDSRVAFLDVQIPERDGALDEIVAAAEAQRFALRMHAGPHLSTVPSLTEQDHLEIAEAHIAAIRMERLKRSGVPLNALTSPPYALQQSSHGAQLFRQAFGFSLGQTGGVAQGGDFALTQNGTPNMSVNAAAGRIAIPGTSLATVNPGGGAYAPQGLYFAESDVATNLPISASSPSLPRLDQEIGQVQDAAYTGLTNSAQLAILTGTPTSGAALNNLVGLASLPASSLLIGYALVPANATTIVTADLATVVPLATPGLGVGGPSVRGAVNIPGPESRTNVAYGTMPTPDQVTGIVLPANGLLRVWYQASWQESVSGAASVAIFIGSNQLKIYNDTSGTVAGQSAVCTGTGSNDFLFTNGSGLVCTGSSIYPGDVTTGQVLGQASNFLVPSGGPCDIFGLPAGTYTVSVQFKASSGSVTASNRKLWVQALSFA